MVDSTATSFNTLVVPVVRGVHVTAVGEVRIFPESPTAIRAVPSVAIPYKSDVIPDVCEVQVVPVGEV